MMNGNTYAKGLNGEVLALARVKEIYPQYHWIATCPTHPFDLLAYGWNDAPVMAIEVKTVKFEPGAKLSMHSSQIKCKKSWLRDNGRPIPMMLAIDPDTGQMKVREGIKCFPIDKMEEI